MRVLILLLGILMTPPIRPEPPKFVPGALGLSKAWQRYLTAPFVQDTLAPLVGPNPVAVVSRPMPPLGMDKLRGITLPYGFPASSNNPTEIRLFEGPNDDLFVHEVGHVLDYRRIAADVADTIRTIFATKKPRFYYAGQPTTDYSEGSGYAAEYVAETFQQAVELVRAAEGVREQRRQNLEKSFPGVSLWYNWLLSKLNHPEIATQP